MRIRLEIAYDGTGYEGWQIQNRGRTVQGVLEEALQTLEKQPVRLTAAGRTDSGVHARAQIAHFDSSIHSMPAEKFVPALNRLIPGDVRIISASRAPESFHARYDACARSYRYRLRRWESASPFIRWAGVYRRNLPSLEALNRAASVLPGTHDFSAFACAGDASESKVRTIYQAAFLETSGVIEFRITGNAFLWKMVRSIVGTIISCPENADPAEYMRAILSSCDRTRVGTTAPAGGLTFWRVHYNRENLYG